MRCCPKCGDKYDENDFRTMCSSCLVSLIPCDGTESSSTSGSSKGVDLQSTSVLTQPMPMPTVTMPMPTVTVPENRQPIMPQPILPTEVPQIPPAPTPPQPSPDTPLTPQPDPEYPQPTIVPEPGPVPMPPSPPQEPIPTAKAQPAQPKTVKTVSFSQSHSTKYAEPKPERLTDSEKNTGKLIAMSLAILSGIVCFITIITLFGTSADKFTFWTLVFHGGLIFLSVYLVRQALYRSVIERANLAVTGDVCLGDTLNFLVTVGVLRTVRVTEGTVTITAEEVATSGSGNSKTSFKEIIFHRTIPLKLSPQWIAESLVTLHPELTLPADAMPSFNRDHNKITWKAQLWIGIPGLYPDIRLTIPLVIPARRRREEQADTPLHQRYSLVNLGDVNAVIELECAMTPENIPLLHVKQRMPFSLEITPKNAEENRTLWIELAYKISGSGSGELVKINRVACFPHGWRAETQQVEDSVLTIPKDAPISYRGMHIHVEWMICVYREYGWHRNLRQIFPICVEPELVD